MTGAEPLETLLCLDCARPAPADAHYCSYCGKGFAPRFDASPSALYRQVSDAPHSLPQRSARPPASSAFPPHDRPTEPPHVADPLTSPLPNLSLCTWIYPKSSESPFGRYCPGAPERPLDVPQLALPPGEYLLAVMQDQDAYTRSGPPPVYENVSDDYRLQLSAVSPSPEHELEPNDSTRRPSEISAAGAMRGQLSFMRDLDVVCTAGPGAVRFRVEEASDHPRPRSAVLEVKTLAGPDRDVPVRVHRSQQGFTRSPRDAVSPWLSAAIPSAGASVCLELTLVANPWGESPPPDVAPASDSEYLVHVEML